MNNVSQVGHKWVGKKAIFRKSLVTPELLAEKREANLVMRPGDEVRIEKVFYDWNNVKGLTMLWVENLSSTNSIKQAHVTPDDLGLK